jgi:hypothetical protein
MAIKSYSKFDDVLASGKYQGIRLGRVMEIDPQWLVDELRKNPKFYLSQGMEQEAMEHLKQKKAAR